MGVHSERRWVYKCVYLRSALKFQFVPQSKSLVEQLEPYRWKLVEQDRRRISLAVS